MTYQEMENHVFADGYHIGFWGKREPCRFALIDSRIHAIHDCGTLWTGMIASDVREAVWTIKHSNLGRVWGVIC